MTSSPRSVTASSAFMKAMLAPAVTTTVLPPLDLDAVLRAQLGGDRLHQRRDALDRLVLVVLGVGEERADVVDRLLRRAVVDHSLAQGDGAGIVADQRRDRGDDGRLHCKHPGHAIR